MGFNYLLLFIQCQQGFIILKYSDVKSWIEKLAKPVRHELKPQNSGGGKFSKRFLLWRGVNKRVNIDK